MVHLFIQIKSWAGWEEEARPGQEDQEGGVYEEAFNKLLPLLHHCCHKYLLHTIDTKKNLAYSDKSWIMFGLKNNCLYFNVIE